MKVLNVKFDGFPSLEREILKQNFQDEKSLLIQFFDGRNSLPLFEEMAKTLFNLLPNATILGATTAGEIFDGKMLDNSVVISLCAFQKTKLIPLSSSTCNEESAVAIAQKIPKNAKAAIFFSEGINSNAEMFLHGMYSVHKELVIAGGQAADYNRFSKTYISLNDKVFHSGVVGVAFDNPNLTVLSQWKLDWNPIGKSMRVTKADKNVVYELDNKPIKEVIRHYFGNEIASNLPHSIVKFPLIKDEEGLRIARSAIGVKDDGLVLAGMLKVDDYVRFGIANIDAMRENNTSVLKYKPDAVWIYSCMARKAFAGTLLEGEFQTFSSNNPICGFFVYGEFFKLPNISQMLNLTTTVFALSETADMAKNDTPKVAHIDDDHNSISAMSHLTNAVVSDLESTIKILDGYKIALDANTIVSKTDPNGVITYVNNLMQQITGYTDKEMIGKTHYLLRHKLTPSSQLKNMWDTARQGKMWKGFTALRAKSGEACTVETAIIPIFDEHKNITEFITTSNDLTEAIKQKSQILRQSIDSLTGLPNRIKLFEDIKETENPVIAIINIDNFGEINRFYGFESGNALLKEFSEKLAELSSPMVCRLYKLESDNFILLSCTKEVDELCSSIENLIIKKIHEHQFLSENQGITVRMSVGIAVGKSQTLSRAEDALKQARSKKRSWFMSSDEDDAMHQENFKMLNILKSAIEQDGIVPYYQAIINLATGKTARYESLMRLIDKSGKIYAPHAFLEVAQKSKYYFILTQIMVKKVLSDFENLTDCVSINLSAEDIENKETVAFLEKSIKNFPEPSRITIELTETEAIRDYLAITNFIALFKGLGVKIAIDDFGSGYSNFAYLAQFNADILKIDGTLIKKISTDNNTYQVVAAINDFAKRMGLSTVAEFVFDEKTSDMVKKLGIDFAQGYFYAKPVPFEELNR